MSMNLYIKVDGECLKVYQTPTYITYMCLVNSKNEIKPSITGKKALRVVYAYLYWVDSTSDGVYENIEAAEYQRSVVRKHREYIAGALLEHKKLEVYTL